MLVLKPSTQQVVLWVNIHFHVTRSRRSTSFQLHWIHYIHIYATGAVEHQHCCSIFGGLDFILQHFFLLQMNSSTEDLKGPMNKQRDSNQVNISISLLCFCPTCLLYCLYVIAEKENNRKEICSGRAKRAQSFKLVSFNLMEIM